MRGNRFVVWWPDGRAQNAPDPATLGPGVETFRALEGPAELAYVEGIDDAILRAAYPSVRITRQHLLQSCEGASAGARAPFHYIVATDVRPEAEDDFNAWYANAHLPGLAGVPGTVRAQRLRNDDDAPRYHACYDLVTAETLGSPAWLAVRATEWSGRVRPCFRNTTRLMLRRR